MCLRVLIPAVLVITAIANVGLRFLPPEHMALRSWEAVTLFVKNAGPFAASKHYFNPASTGDLGTLANLPAYRRPHPEVFTTGEQGYRGYEPGKDPAPAAILFGDSFGAGASVSDSDSLCARLGPVFGGPVFFAGYYVPNFAEKLKSLPRTRLIILQLSERYALNDAAPGDADGAEGAIKRFFPATSAAYRDLRYLHNYVVYSPLEIWAARAYRHLQNDVILPNVHTKNVVRYSLRNHDELLFLRSELLSYVSPPPPLTRSLFESVNALRAEGHKVLVILVPNKLTVYYPLLENGPPPTPEDHLYLNVLEGKLNAASIPAVNLTPALRRAAAEGLDRHALVYHSDDTHWNSEGIRVAAEAVCAATGKDFAFR
jgi:hypothetical protein